MKKSTEFASLALMVLCLGIGSTAMAGTKYKTSAIAKSDFQTMDWNGGKVTVGTLKGVLETYGSTSTNVPNGQSIQNCVIRSVRIKDTTDIVANCTITDKDGDILYAISERKQGDVSAGTGGKGKTRFVGGTGKYQGASGGCDYQTKYLPENWLAVESECTRD